MLKMKLILKISLMFIDFKLFNVKFVEKEVIVNCILIWVII